MEYRANTKAGQDVRPASELLLATSAQAAPCRWIVRVGNQGARRTLRSCKHKSGHDDLHGGAAP